MDKDFKLKPGDKVVWIRGKDVNHKYTSFIRTNDSTIKQFEGEDKVLKVLRPTGYKTVYEAEKAILDEEEKEYLSHVIRPFRDRIKSIVKCPYFDGKKYWIDINLIREESMSFPIFNKNTMYKGMELDKEYTLEELGL